MASTLATLADVQAHRAAALPARAAEAPLHTVLLEQLQRRNAWLDGLYYDVSVIRPEERPELAFWLAEEGAILIVPPSGGAPLNVCRDKDQFFAAGGGRVTALTVAGVGSSALGAAALARNVADAIGAPAAAVVSGYGLADVVTEALGGFFWFGALNGLRHAFEGLDRGGRLAAPPEIDLATARGLLPLSADTATLVDLLSDRRSRLDLLVGHSKGNLVISEALYALAESDPARTRALSRRLRLVTIGARIGMPPAYRRVIDVMGAQDWFGALNSRPDIPSDLVVAGAGHSTSRDLPGGGGLDVTAVLREVLPWFADRIRFGPETVAAPGDLPQRTVATLAAGI